VSIYLAANPSVADLTGSSRRVAMSAALGRSGLIVVAVHAILLAGVHWMLFAQFADRAMPDLYRPLASAFTTYSANAFVIEALALVAAVVAAAGIRLITGSAGHGATIAAAGLLAYVPVACYSLGVLLALSFGWEPDVFIMSSAGATDPQVSATIVEALPIVLQPLAMWRQLATAVGALVFAVLLRRLCGISTGRSIATAAAAGLAALVVQFTML
jgi:hypothetical protein